MAVLKRNQWLLLPLLLLLFMGCDSCTDNQLQNPIEETINDEDLVITDQVLIMDENDVYADLIEHHTVSENENIEDANLLHESMGWTGIYRGIFPSETSEGIKVQLKLRYIENFGEAFCLVFDYISDNYPIPEIGSPIWSMWSDGGGQGGIFGWRDESEGIIYLDLGHWPGNWPPLYQIGDGVITLLDSNEFIIYGEVAELTKVDFVSSAMKLLESLHLGMSRSEVDNILRVEPQRVSKAYWSGGPEFSYRYDVLRDSRYRFIEPHGIDNADIGGLKEGRVRLTIWVTYDDQDKVFYFTALYSTDDGVIYEYRFFKDGSHRHRQI